MGLCFSTLSMRMDSFEEAGKGRREGGIRVTGNTGGAVTGLQLARSWSGSGFELRNQQGQGVGTQGAGREWPRLAPWSREQ